VALEREDLAELLELTERQLEELRELRRELLRQSELLERLVVKADSLERSQYS
jgi:hypothetical protein